MFINNSTYFTLEEAQLSTGGDAGTLQFVVRLNNGGSQAVDFNAYGVKVTDDSGLSYAARLTEQQSARVQPGENRDFRFTAQVPPGEKASQLKVDIVAWDYGSSSVSREVGGLHVANVAAEDTNVKRTVISLNEADSSLPQNATVSFTAGRSILVSEDGKSYLYTDVMARNLGSSNFKLPSAVKFRYKDSGGELYTASIQQGGDQTLLPKQDRRLVFKTEVPLAAANGDYTLETTYTKDSQDVVMGSLPLGPVSEAAKIGENVPYSLTSDSGLKMMAQKAVISTQDDGLHVQTTVTVSNYGSKVETPPRLSASYQFGTEGAAVSSADLAAHDTYISPQETENYYFYAILPSGVDPKTLSMALLENGTASSVSAPPKHRGLARPEPMAAIPAPAIVAVLARTAAAQAPAVQTAAAPPAPDQARAARAPGQAVPAAQALRVPPAAPVPATHQHPYRHPAAGLRFRW
ncbi:hypothetical protein LJK87_27055 [Paenibacillus sp. P25]|nr:hypothetical protein LJK87_27055 [Paenibacillus sp. P25]